MENKINVAELLKNCPTGMELDCLTFDNVFFQELDWSTVFPIICYRINNGIKENIHLTEFGSHFSDNDAKCVIFPKGKTTWEGFQKPFKDGDIIYISTDGLECGTKTVFISIFKECNDGKYNVYAGYSVNTNSLYSYHITNAYFCDVDAIIEQRLATEEEKQKLFQAIKDKGYKWNPKTKTLENLFQPKFKVGDVIRRKGDYISGVVVEIYNDYECKVKYKEGSVSYVSIKAQDNWELVLNKFDINTLKPFQKVLVRNYNYDIWKASFWGCLINSEHGFKYDTIRGCYKQCIPYEGNEHLLRTTNDCNEHYKNW